MPDEFGLGRSYTFQLAVRPRPGTAQAVVRHNLPGEERTVVGITHTETSTRKECAVKTDALSFIESEHKKMKKIMSELEETTAPAKRERLFMTMKMELMTHEALEEEIFYPALRKHAEAKDIVMEGYEEHHAVDVLIAELETVPFDDETWEPKFTVIKENIEHHIEEEEGEMFTRARKALEREQLEELGARMEAVKEQRHRAA